MKKKGRGVAATVYPTGNMAGGISGVYLHVREDGSVNLTTGSTELGQGSNTVLAQIAAEELGIPLQDITVFNGDTETCPYDVGAIASRQTHISGNAVRAATQEIKKMMQDTASELLEANPEDLRFKDGNIHVVDDPGKSVSFKQIAGLTQWNRRIPMIAEGWHVPNISKGIDPEDGHGDPFPAYQYQAVVAEIEVDTETGFVEILKLHAALECGRIINPLLAEGQLEGGMMIGIGFGLRENLIPYYPEVDSPSPYYSPYQQATDLADYLIGTSEDVPFLNEALIDCPDPTGPYGAVGMGEFTANCVGTAIANAIHDAIGVRIFSAPCTPERVLAALKTNKSRNLGNKTGSGDCDEGN